MRFLIESLHEDLNRIKVKPPSQNDIEIPRTMINNINFIVKSSSHIKSFI